MAGGNAIQALRQPGGRRAWRLIRDPEFTAWKVLDLDASSRPPWVQVRIEIKATLFGNDERDSLGSHRRRHKHALIWTLELVGAAGYDAAWRLAASADG